MIQVGSNKSYEKNELHFGHFETFSVFVFFLLLIKIFVNNIIFKQFDHILTLLRKL